MQSAKCKRIFQKGYCNNFPFFTFHFALCNSVRRIPMLIKSCFNCSFHEVREGDEEQMSHCGKENCWSEFSKCVAKKALNRFLEQETTGRESMKAQTARP